MVKKDGRPVRLRLSMLAALPHGLLTNLVSFVSLQRVNQECTN